jgi:uncharacterized membrane protein YfcA
MPDLLHNWPHLILAALAIIFIGISKAGFGGGVGILVTPVVALVFPPTEAIGILLPLLSAGDAFSLYHYWGKWEKSNVRYLIPGTFVGIVCGIGLIGILSDRYLGQAIGVICIVFVLFQWIREYVHNGLETYKPRQWHGNICGLFAGITSTIAHAAGSVVSIFLLPQRLDKEIFVGTTVLVFAIINWMKLPFFIWKGLIHRHTLLMDLCFLPLIPVGVWLGVWMNRRLPAKHFTHIIYVIVLLTGIELLGGKSLVGSLLSK